VIDIDREAKSSSSLSFGRMLLHNQGNKQNLSLHEKALLRIDQLEVHTRRLFNAIDPWERCLRFHWRPNCESGKYKIPSVYPCSTDILKEFSLLVIGLLEKNNFTYWVSYGTLLGVVRDGGIIPWTYDADVVIDGDQFKEMERVMAKELEPHGFLLFHDRKIADIARVCVSESHPKYSEFAIHTVDSRAYFNHYPYMDIYQTDKKYQDVVVKYGPLCKFKQEVVFPLTRYPFYDTEVWVPANYTAYLNQIYGDFMNPPPKGKQVGHGTYADACKNG